MLHPLALLAAEQVKIEIDQSTAWKHNFGFNEQCNGYIRGKMFGVLVVKTVENQIGYLKAFSGKLDNQNHHQGFVPPVFDALTDGSFLNVGMVQLSQYSAAIDELRQAVEANQDVPEELTKAIERRKQFSQALHAKFYNSFVFINTNGEYRSLYDIFRHTNKRNPPAGAGECAAPKLYQYALINKLQPIALAEFYWGAPITTDSCLHGQYYPCCHDKCLPILQYMLHSLLYV
jgi:tRNA pseudouridine32 synthase / 23S rRNA pseudouridine746 synthase